MKENKSKYGFALIILLITIIYIINNITGLEDKLIPINYMIIFLIFVTWIISIVRTIKEKNKIKIIPCVIITGLTIIAYILVNNIFFPQFYIRLLAQIGLAIFLYEVMDLLKIELRFNMMNVIISLICIFIIITFLLSQIMSINKYKSSLRNISNFIKLNDLSYEKLSTEFDSMVLEHINFDNSLNKKIFVTPAYMYEGYYGWAVDGLRGIYANVITNKQTFNEFRQNLERDMDSIINAVKQREKEINKDIMQSIIIAVFEITMVCIVGVRNKESN